MSYNPKTRKILEELERRKAVKENPCDLSASVVNPSYLKSRKNVGVSEVRDLFGVVESEGAVCGIYITRNPPTSAMTAKQQGQFKPEMYQPFDRLQIVTVQQILDGERMNLPLMEEVAKKAKRNVSDGSDVQERLIPEF